MPLLGNLSTYLLTGSFLRTFTLRAKLAYLLRKCCYTLTSGGSRPLIYLFTKQYFTERVGEVHDFQGLFFTKAQAQA